MTKGRYAGFKIDAIRRANTPIGVISIGEGIGPGSRFYWQAGRLCPTMPGDAAVPGRFCA